MLQFLNGGCRNHCKYCYFWAEVSEIHENIAISERRFQKSLWRLLFLNLFSEILVNITISELSPVAGKPLPRPLFSRPGQLVLVDLQAAFSSFSHNFLFSVLEGQGVPDDFIHRLKAFYHNNYHEICFDGDVSPSFGVFSGVRQGCPMSPVWFALALDPFLDYLCRQLPVSNMVRAYADDMAIVMSSGGSLPTAISFFELLAQASCLQANDSKTVYIPLYEADIAQTRGGIAGCRWSAHVWLALQASSIQALQRIQFIAESLLCVC